MKRDELVLVLGATGQQGGSTAKALRDEGWRVRALVRDPAGEKAKALAAIGVEVMRGDFRERASLDAALVGVHGVFSIQPSSGQPEYGVTDEDETRWGKELADAAKAARVKHFVYTSVAGLRADTRVGHFESKWQIEEYVRASGLPATIVRPATFMELLLLPHFGVGQGTLVFFFEPDQPCPFIAVEDIGVVVARIFADREAYLGRTLALATELLTGTEIVDKISRATGREVRYAKFPEEVLAGNTMLRRLTELFESGMQSVDDDLAETRRLHPASLTFDAWLEKSGARAILALPGA